MRSNAAVRGSTSRHSHNSDSRLLATRELVVADSSLNCGAAGSQHAAADIDVHVQVVTKNQWRNKADKLLQKCAGGEGSEPRRQDEGDEANLEKG